MKIDAAFEKNPAVAYGTVSVNFESGSVALIPKGGGVGVRVVWEKSARTKNLPVPEGTYRIVGYRIEREQKGEIWTLCASGNHGPEVTIAKGKNVALKPDGRVRIQSAAQPRHGVSVNVKLTDESHLGVVVLKGSERTAAAFEALDGGGKAIHQGTLAYG